MRQSPKFAQEGARVPTAGTIRLKVWQGKGNQNPRFTRKLAQLPIKVHKWSRGKRDWQLARRPYLQYLAIECQNCDKNRSKTRTVSW